MLEREGLRRQTIREQKKKQVRKREPKWFLKVVSDAWFLLQRHNSQFFFSTCSSFILRLLFLSIEITVNTQKVLQSTNCTIFKSIEKRVWNSKTKKMSLLYKRTLKASKFGFDRFGGGPSMSFTRFEVAIPLKYTWPIDFIMHSRCV